MIPYGKQKLVDFSTWFVIHRVSSSTILTTSTPFDALAPSWDARTRQVSTSFPQSVFDVSSMFNVDLRCLQTILINELANWCRLASLCDEGSNLWISSSTCASKSLSERPIACSKKKNYDLSIEQRRVAKQRRYTLEWKIKQKENLRVNEVTFPVKNVVPSIAWARSLRNGKGCC